MCFSELSRARLRDTNDVPDRQKATPSEAILAVSRLLGDLATSETAAAACAALVREARALFAVDGAVLLGVDPQAATVTVLDADPPTADEHPMVPRPLTALPAVRELLAQGARSSQPAPEQVNVAELVGWPSQPRTTLLIALRHGDLARHVLVLVDSGDRQFSTEERNLATAFAAAAAGALAQVRLASEHQRRIAQLSALARAAKTVNENLEITPLLTAICAEARAITTADAVAIYLPDGEGGVVAEAADGLGPAMVGYRLALGEGLAGRVAQAGHSLAADDYQALAQPPPDSPVADVRSALAVPMRWEGALRGVLSVGFRRTHHADHQELRLLETFGDLAAAACRNANATVGLALAARTDALTGCLNHAALHDGLRLEIERCARTQQQLSLVLLDLDEFKQVNERHGHLVGDEVLRRVGQALRSAVRPYDLCARYGGDEFAIVCSDAAEEDAAEVATRAMQRLAEALADMPEAVGTGATAGVAAWREGQVGTDLLEDADRALLYGKQQGHRREVLLASDLPETFRPLRFRRVDEPGAAPPEMHAHRQAERLQKRSRQLLLASALGTRLAGIREAEAIVQTAVDELNRAFGYFRCEVVRVGDGEPSGVVGRALAEGRAIADEDGAHSELAAPIWVGGRLWGAIDVEESRPGAFDDEDSRLVQIVADQLGAALHSAGLYEQLEQAYLGTADALTAALDARDAGTPRSDSSIAPLCDAVGRRLGMDADALRELRYGAALHDVGKIAVPETILDKPGELEPGERAVLEGHPLVGQQIVEPLDPLAGVSPLIRHEHERWDGTGYPDRLAGEDIPLGARIIFACDAYQAMVSERPFRAPLPADQARAELQRNAGTQFDPVVVDALLAVLDGSTPSAD